MLAENSFGAPPGIPLEFLHRTSRNSFGIPPEIAKRSSKNSSKFLLEFFWRSSENFSRAPCDLLQEFLWSFSRKYSAALPEIPSGFLQEFLQKYIFRGVPPGIFQNSSSYSSGILLSSTLYSSENFPRFPSGNATVFLWKILESSSEKSPRVAFRALLDFLQELLWRFSRGIPSGISQRNSSDEFTQEFLNRFPPGIPPGIFSMNSSRDFLQQFPQELLRRFYQGILQEVSKNPSGNFVQEFIWGFRPEIC